MTRSELVQRRAQRTRGLNAPDVAICVDHLLDAIAGRLGTGGRVEIKGFGAWPIYSREARQGWNPATVALVQVLAKRTVRFKAGQDFRQRVDRG